MYLQKVNQICGANIHVKNQRCDDIGSENANVTPTRLIQIAFKTHGDVVFCRFD